MAPNHPCSFKIKGKKTLYITPKQDSSLHQQYVSPDDTSVEMVSMTSRNSRTNWNPWSRASYDVVGEASRNQKSVSVVNDEDDDSERKIEEGSSVTRRRVPRWFSRAVLILISLLVAAVLVTISGKYETGNISFK